MFEEELIDLMTFRLQNSDSAEIFDKHKRITEIDHNCLLMVVLML